MKRYLLFALIIPIILTSVFSQICFYISFQNLIRIIFWLILFVSFGHILLPWALLIYKKKGILFLGPLRILFIILFTYFAWILPYLKLTFFAPEYLWSLYSIFVLGSFFGIYLMHKKSTHNWNEDLKHFATQDIIFIYTFILFLVLHSFMPDTSWGEKTMDMSTLSYFIRRDYFPVMDHWSPTHLMKYYYWGYYAYAGFIKMVGLPNTLGYNIVAATLPALTVGAFYSLFRWATKSWFIGLFGSVLVLIGSNWASVYVHLIDLTKNRFWYSTRVFLYDLFAEYPIWTYVFKDLHPHVFNLPITIALFYFLYFAYDQREQNPKSSWPIFIIIGVVLGCMTGFNGWDFLIFSLFLFIYFIINLRRNIILTDIRNWAIAFGIIILMYLPMINALKTGKKIVFVKNYYVYNQLINYFNFMGHWLVLIILLGTWFFFFRKIKKIKIDFLLLIPLSLILIFIYAYVFDVRVFPSMILVAVFILLGIYTLQTGIRNQTKETVFACQVIGISIFMTVFAEHMLFMDRANTLFKIMTNVWTWMGIGTVMLLRFPKNILSNIFRKYPAKILGTVLISLISLVCLVSFIGTYLMSKTFYAGSSGITLDPLNPFQWIDRGAYETVQWINKNIQGTPTFLEGVGRHAFDLQTLRITKYTGVPVFIGWPNHVKFRGTPFEYAQQKVGEVEYMYNTVDVRGAYSMIRKNHIHYIFMGSTEQRRYRMEGLKKFFNYPEYFKEVFSSHGSYLFKVID